MKAYNIVLNDEEDSAEVNLYGEVVSNRPVDWWSGEKIEGLYIVLEEFLKDIDTLKNKSSVIFHINSPGGEVYAGTSIYNRMKQFNGTVTTIVDGLAASAASIIAQGATAGHRKVCNGSLTMIHGASLMLFGYYNINDMKNVMRQTSAVDKSIAEIYTKCTGLEADKVKSMMNTTTWMTSQEAVENGFADEVVETDKVVDMSLNENKSFLMVNGVQMPVRGLFNLPDYIQVKHKVTAGNEPDVIKKEKDGGMESMHAAELKASQPDLYEQVRAEIVQELGEESKEAAQRAVEKEIARIKEIDEIAGKIADKQLVEDAKYGEKKMSAGDLALAALKKQKDAGKDFLNNMQDDSKSSGADEVTATPNAGNFSMKEQEAQDIADGAMLIAGVKKKEETK
ncbi:MAG: Clp protease ClpP [Bacillus sp. (in: Bacteria)]|nr:Clp protease ClpP [Bacillus sp. (in: firmicutes)]MCM1427120.1 Clp protease ClpP [Eubacterium sp.]